MDFVTKKEYFKKRQVLYNLMNSINKPDNLNCEVEIDGNIFQKCEPELASHIFIWFDRKPMVCHYYHDHKSFMVGDQQMHISNPNKKSNRVIAFVNKINSYETI